MLKNKDKNDGRIFIENNGLVWLKCWKKNIVNLGILYLVILFFKIEVKKVFFRNIIKCC